MIIVKPKSSLKTKSQIQVPNPDPRSEIQSPEEILCQFQVYWKLKSSNCLSVSFNFKLDDELTTKDIQNFTTCLQCKEIWTKERNDIPIQYVQS